MRTPGPARGSRIRVHIYRSGSIYIYVWNGAPAFGGRSLQVHCLASVVADIRERILPGYQLDIACQQVSAVSDSGVSRCHQSNLRIQAIAGYRGAFVARCVEQHFGAIAPEGAIGEANGGESQLAADLNNRFRNERRWLSLTSSSA